jgi:hypothetical protein
LFRSSFFVLRSSFPSARLLLRKAGVNRVVHTRRSHTALAGSLAVLAAVLSSTDAKLDADSPPHDDTFIQRVVEQTTREGVAIRATRDLRAGTVSGKHEGWMRVETRVTPAGAFSWRVLAEGGSDRTRDKVFRALLENEAEAWREGLRDAAALTPDNYEFLPLTPVADGPIQIRLKPRREDSRLVNGILTVSADGYPLRLEGTLAKSPSFWVRSVRVVKTYGRFAGVALPTMLESHADVRLVGRSSFVMNYHYNEVNGRAVRNVAVTDDSTQ